MRLIIQPDYKSVSKWAANYVASRIKAANPTPEKPSLHVERLCSILCSIACCVLYFLFLSYHSNVEKMSIPALNLLESV